MTNNKKLLTDEFINKYPDFPAHMNALGQFVYLRTYSRYLPEQGRRETWKETVSRSTEYNVNLAIKHTEDIGYKVDYDKYRKEAEEFFDSMFNLRQFLSGRTLWVGGADGGVAEKYPLANFNCSFVSIKSWEDIGDLFYLLLVGTGVGYRSTKEMARNMPPIRTNVEVIHEPFTQRYPLVKEDTTQLFLINDGKKAVIHVGDSKEGWVESLRLFLRIHSEKEYENVEQIGIYYDYIRPLGSRLHTFGGTASGYEPLKEMFEGITKVFRNELDSSLEPLECVYNTPYRRVRPVHILDIGNLIGNNVVIGGVRRTAEIFLFDSDDYESMFAKYGINGIWNVEQHEKIIGLVEGLGMNKLANELAEMKTQDPNVRPLHHRRMSNNSVAFESKPNREQLNLIFELMQSEGEPGLINMEEANRRRPNVEGLNPCFRGDMKLLTEDGYKTFEELSGKKVRVVNKDGNITEGKVWCSGEKEIVEIKFINRDSIFTTIDHVFMLTDETECETKDLKGKRIMPFLQRNKNINNKFVKFGFIQGDGQLTRLDSDAHKGIEVNIGGKDGDILRKVFGKSEDDLLKDGRTLYITGIKDELKELGFSTNQLPSRLFPNTFDSWDKVDKLSFLRGMYSANGSVINAGGRSRVAYKTTNRDVAEKLKETLKSFEIKSYITTNKPKSNKFPNGIYEMKQSYDVNISKYTSQVTFYSSIGFEQEYKSSKLESLLIANAPMVVNVIPTGRKEKVYDFNEPELHWGVVEGVIAHNCAEILLDSYGVCNLTTVNLMQFVVKENDYSWSEEGRMEFKGSRHTLDTQRLYEAQRHSVRAGLRMTLVELELPHWDKVQQRDRLLGTSMTGVKDALSLLNYTVEEEQHLLDKLGRVARDEADRYAKELRVNAPLLVTTVKPEGTISQVAGGVSSGLHWSHSPYYIRRIRINAEDPLAKAVQDLGWTVHAEVGTDNLVDVESLAKPEIIAKAKTLVIDFPVASGSDKTKDDVRVEEQFKTYFDFQYNYTEHNSSNTVHVRPDEWAEVESIVYDNWDDYVGVSFLAHDGGSYTLAPYEAITEDQYIEMIAKLPEFDSETLKKYETGKDSDLEGMDGCEGGLCPVR